MFLLSLEFSLIFSSNTLDFEGENKENSRNPLFIVSSSKIQIEKILERATWWMQKATFFFFIFLSIAILFSVFTKSAYENVTPIPIPSKTFSLEKIGKGPLALQSFVQKTSFPDLTLEVALLAKNPHTEVKGKKGDFLLYLKSSGTEYKARNGEQIFLSCDSLPGGLAPVYRFSDYKTPLWIKPEFTRDEKVLLEVGLFTLSKETGLFQEEKMEIWLQADPALRKKKDALPFIEILQKGKVWGQDVVLHKFAQDKYKSFKDKIKLEIVQQGKRVFFFLGKGDLLSFHQGQWIPVELGQSMTDTPTAEVKKATAKSMELEIWDPDAFYSFPIKLEMTPPQHQGSKAECLPHSIKWKSGKMVSCLFGKRKHALKEGDWLLKGERGWRHLRRSVDKEAYISHKINGELFIFEALVKEQGKLVMKGFLVDEMRVQSFPFSSVVTVDPKLAKTSSKSEKKQVFLKKSDPLPTTYFFPSSHKQISEGEHE